MRKAAHPLGSVDSLNPRRWRGEPLHHHGGGVCWLFVLLWMDLWRHELVVCKIWYKNNLKMRLMALLFDPPTRAPYLQLFATVDSQTLIAKQKCDDQIWMTGEKSLQERTIK
jgi:hypothetical protein